MNMGSSSGNADWYWIFWWIFTLIMYAVLIIWWRREIKIVDKKNAEKFARLKQYREEQLLNAKNKGEE